MNSMWQINAEAKAWKILKVPQEQSLGCKERPSYCLCTICHQRGILSSEIRGMFFFLFPVFVALATNARAYDEAAGKPPAQPRSAGSMTLYIQISFDTYD